MASCLRCLEFLVGLLFVPLSLPLFLSAFGFLAPETGKTSGSGTAIFCLSNIAFLMFLVLEYWIQVKWGWQFKGYARTRHRIYLAADEQERIAMDSMEIQGRLCRAAMNFEPFPHSKIWPSNRSDFRNRRVTLRVLVFGVAALSMIHILWSMDSLGLPKSVGDDANLAIIIDCFALLVLFKQVWNETKLDKFFRQSTNGDRTFVVVFANNSASSIEY